MPKFEATRQVAHSPDEMFALVADVERYPEFLPLCEALTVQSRRERDGKTQIGKDSDVIPEGATGYHQTSVTITA